jgi:serine/threonine protein kinase
MPTRVASVRDVGGQDRIDRAVRSLEGEWGHGEPVLERHWSHYQAGGAVSVLTALVKADLRCRYDRGQRPSVAGYLERFPELRAEKNRVLSLIYEEYCLREEHGERPEAEEFCDRYASWSDSLASQLRYHQLLSRVVAPSSPPPRFPEPGERFQEFQLDSLLGRGGAAWVYLARDESLGSREVVLKVSPDRGNEPSIMGRLDHAHIVPVHKVAFDSATGLRGLCMPYRPGLPLDAVIRRVQPASRPRAARALWEAVAPPDLAPRDPVKQSGWNTFPVRGTYADAVAWLSATLARALAYAHDEEILHRDVKPANVLLTLRDGPQLLDFNLSHDPHSSDSAEAALRGGTLPYMAPEQLEAFLDPARWGEVGREADQYSLGLVLRELLTGEAPETPDQGLPLPRAIRSLLDRRAESRLAVRAHNPTIPHALEAITACCLAYAPTERYPSAGTLADDLERFLKRRPLVYAVNPSRRERAANYLRRHRLVLLPAVVIFCVVLGAELPEQIRKWTPIERRATFVKALEDIEGSQYREAIVPLRSLVKEAPEFPVTRFYLGFALEKTDQHDEGIVHFTKALNAPNAETTFQDWGRRHPNLAQHLTSFGLALHNHQNYPLAQEAFAIALLIDPKSVQARIAVAVYLERQYKPGPALALWTELIEEAEHRNTPDDRDNLGTWYLIRAKLAIHHGKAQSATPGQALAEAGESYSRALEDLDRAEAILPQADRKQRFEVNCLQAETLIARGDLELRSRHDDAASDAYRKAEDVLRRIDPRDGPDSSLVPLSQELRARLELPRSRWRDEITRAPGPSSRGGWRRGRSSSPPGPHPLVPTPDAPRGRTRAPADGASGPPRRP